MVTPLAFIVIKDFVMDQDRLEPPFGALFALNMLVGTDHGDTFTETEIRGWLKGAGFGKVERLEDSGGSGLMVGHKG